MARYIAKRLVLLIIIIIFVSVATFFLVHLLPGNPATTILGPNATAAERRHGQPRARTEPAAVAAVLHLDRPRVPGQPRTVVHDPPVDDDHHRPVVPDRPGADHLLPDHRLRHRVPDGDDAARRPNRLFDQASNSTTFAFLALPPFVIAPVLVLIFAVHWHVFPGPASYVPLTQDFWSNIHTMLLPSIVLALGSIVVYFRLLRNDLISTLQEDFITMARSKGLSDRRIMWRHALRPSSISLLASAGVTIGSLIAGTFVVELLLQMPGLGYQLISSVNQDDYTVVQGITLFVAVAIVLINFIFDFLFTIVDPRIARE